ncbi:MAG TPA: hypothetical protein VF846_15620, partial [Thermoanaerobaculia bacterium]
MYRALVIVSALGRRLPLRVAQFFGRAVGRLAWHVARSERRKALRNISIAFPDWTDARRIDAIRAMFRHLGMMVFELAWLPNLRLDSRSTFE